VNEGVHFTPRGQITPLGAKFTPRGEIHPLGPGVKLRMALSGVQLSWRLRAKLAPSAVKMYNATSKLVYFEKKNILL
jgi:hypothetical protein